MLTKPFRDDLTALTVEAFGLSGEGASLYRVAAEAVTDETKKRKAVERASPCLRILPENGQMPPVSH
ncbi:MULTISPECIES: hypothetical protein [unclassified Methylobacterium]|uniref:hypothetical protein n=1 Tax=unclassified Methylobacterium TaxID=2615210 RepID=UPI003701D41D